MVYASHVVGDWSGQINDKTSSQIVFTVYQMTSDYLCFSFQELLGKTFHVFFKVSNLDSAELRFNVVWVNLFLELNFKDCVAALFKDF